jgi:hypothetical protein
VKKPESTPAPAQNDEQVPDFSPCANCGYPYRAHKWKLPNRHCDNYKSSVRPAPAKAQLCDTTMMERAPRTKCPCDTYPENLGPCAAFVASQREDYCACDHKTSCHRAHWGYASAPVAKAVEEAQASETQKLRGRPVSHLEARIAAGNFVNGCSTRHSIPVRFHDDDVTIMDYIREQEAKDAKRV